MGHLSTAFSSKYASIHSLHVGAVLVDSDNEHIVVPLHVPLTMIPSQHRVIPLLLIYDTEDAGHFVIFRSDGSP